MNDIYKKLYDETRKKCDESHIEDFEIFNAYSNNDPLEVNISELMNIKTSSNIAFIKIAFIALLNRPIDANTLKNWTKKASMPEKEFRKTAISTIIDTEEASNTGKIYKDNIVSDEDVLKNVVKQSNLFLQVARKTYHKMPEPFKDTVRKMRGIKS